ncbi:YCII-related protein [Lysobacter dokdonensis DS-58]|uniref:YCII-related protein n=2 Tax=Noviluteimonas TaxID=3382693 RepID=A0A0A2WGY0_9GAMM|nr:YCII-related protein [Lysobacter dokdonensis DS-58]
MRVMVFAKVPADMSMEPTPEQVEAFAAMDRYTDELVAAGVFVAGAGLKPESESKRVVDQGSERMVVDGPFAEAREVVAGFSIWEVKDMDEALAWAMKAPNFGMGAVEIRPFFEAADLEGFVSPEELAAAPREGERGRLGVA